MEQWAGCLAVVTGASAGIGAATAEKLVRAGIYVVGLARRAERIEELSDKLSNENGRLHPVRCDVTDEQQILNTFKWIEETLGPVSILVNNAGIIHAATLSDGETEIWKETFDINVLSHCICTREAIRSMKKHRVNGVIVNISSVTSRKAPETPTSVPVVNVYPATKAAINAITEMLRIELRHEKSKIKVTTVTPGVCSSELFHTFPPKEAKAMADAFPALMPEDVADAIMYVLSQPPSVQIQDLELRPIGELI